MKTLLQAGASPDGPKDCAESPLILAVLADNEHIVEMLLEHGASTNVVDKEGHTLEGLAATLKFDDISQMIHVHKMNRQKEEGAQEKVEKALDQIRWSLHVRPVRM